MHMVDVEDELRRNVMSWWAGIPVTGHVGIPVYRVCRFESDCGHFIVLRNRFNRYINLNGCIIRGVFRLS